MRVLLSDWIGAEILAMCFDDLATTFWGFDANTYVGMKSHDDRYAALSLFRDGLSVMVTIKKRVKDAYVLRVRAGSGRVVILFAGRRQR